MNRLQSKLEKVGSNPILTAKSVGLRYAAHSFRGYYRLKNKENFTYVDENQQKIRDKEVLERIRLLVIPPAWENVWISPYDNGHLQVTGIDLKGRKQYRYHANWNKIRNQSKFYRIRRFAKVLPSIRKQVETDLRRKGMPYEKVVALVVKLIEMTNIRIGNEAYKKLYGSFGLTTLRDKHVKFGSGKVDFTFVGKKGVKHAISLKSPKMMKLVKRCKEIPGQELFQYYDDDGKHHSIGSGDVNSYLKQITGDDFTAKDFRIWAGTVNAMCSFLNMDTPENPTECKRKIIEVLDSVAHKLGNTRTVCKKYYVHPTVIASYEKGSIWKYKPKKSVPGKALNSEERALVRLLEKEQIAEVVG